MMKRLDIDPAGSGLPQGCLSYFTARRRCGSYPRKQACRDRLDRTSAAVRAPPRFRPCTDIPFELQVDRLHR